MTAAVVQPQLPQHSIAVDSNKGPQLPQGQFHHDGHNTPYIPGYPQLPGLGARDGASLDGLHHLLGNMNINNPQGTMKLGGFKGQIPNLNVATGNRVPCNGQLLLFPNGGLLGSLPQMTAFTPTTATVPTQSQLGHIPYLPTNLYPNMNPGVIPGALPGYGWPYFINADQKRNGWINGDDQNGVSSPDDGGQAEHFSVPGIDGFSANATLLNQPCLPLQMMKTSNGYILQDLEALTQQDPPIPRAVPAMWTNPTDMTLAKCLENREGITNVYIRGFLPETTDELLHAYASRFGKIDRCKAIVDLDNGLCKGFGFVQYFNFDSCENCIRGFFYLGYQASFAQKSRNSRLKDLEDKASTNIYCTNVPIDWTEADLRRHFEPYRVLSEKISRDEKTGVSKEVGFARFETREIAEKVLNDFHNIVGTDGVKLLLRFADTKAQKLLKQQSNERRAYRTGEYNYSVEVVQGSTPSPTIHRLQQTASHLSPASQISYNASPMGVSSSWTPASSISPSYPLAKNQIRNGRWSSRASLPPLDHTPVNRDRHSTGKRNSFADTLSAESSKTVLPNITCGDPRSTLSTPQKENTKAGSLSHKEVVIKSPRSAT
ncbi:hypothetical protein ASPZODRAFT_664121 [Penicilliopsis zonata CBS 506.65]|uniref:RRM domain-containing protein n=1 Tax=Penicilliopsis zonata CBS 506.65 TaxID=1073090 RepID=A0A1L9SD25_9EURO|nr:hypothetical protein ASPZODRAFT_664121 [Penicilliopsis zonata CBS 506.65]OJJ44987.1 hypothetical protein ASPZODRAFT_664121 [Penicilliopsis zonata CBS 506.65]